MSAPKQPDDRQRTAKPAVDSNDEPEITQEESVPLDGTDKEGEKMMEKLGEERRAAARKP